MHIRLRIVRIEPHHSANTMIFYCLIRPIGPCSKIKKVFEETTAFLFLVTALRLRPLLLWRRRLPNGSVDDLVQFTPVKPDPPDIPDNNQFRRRSGQQ